MKPLLLNCSYLIKEQARILSKKYKRTYKPIFEDEDVYDTLNYIYEFDKTNHIYKLDDVVSFQWLSNSHCIGAKQLQLILHGENNKVVKILYTSDIGALNTKNHYVDNTKIMSNFNDFCIMESTYGEKTRYIKNNRNFDLEKLKNSILETLINNGKFLFPAFSFSRSQEIMTVLYLIFKDDENFKYNIYVDSLLTNDINKKYSQILQNDNLKLWNQVYNWKYFKYITEKTDSDSIVKDKNPKIIISSSGFCTNGRVLKYLQEYLKDINNCICFSGYVGANNSYLSYKIKNSKKNSKIKINHLSINNNCNCITLSSFSSHANRKDLINFGASQNCNKLILVHGSSLAKKQLREDLENQLSKNDKTTKVIISCEDMILKL